MTKEPIEIMGGESVYCINQSQLIKARELASEDPHSSPRIQGEIQRLESELSRNEQAALAFVMIDRLLQSTAA